MENEEIIIPEGWTYFAHRTNSSKWSDNPFNKEKLILNKIMSVVTEGDIYQELKRYGKDYTFGYSLGEGRPFEIRTLICKKNYLNNLSDENMKNIMYHEFYYDRNNFGGMGGWRHHSIPKGEELIVLGYGKYDEVYEKEKDIIWTIPKRFLEFYKKEIAKNDYRVVSLEETFYIPLGKK